MEKEVIEGVEVIKDGNVTHFIPLEDETKEPAKTEENVGFWQKLLNWLKYGKVTPYVKVRDSADPFGEREDPDAGSDGLKGIEAGIKIRF